MNATVKFIKIRDVMKLRARGKTSTYHDIEEGTLTRPIYIAGKSIAWPEHEIAILNQARLAGKNDEAIKQIVTALHIARTEVAL